MNGTVTETTSYHKVSDDENSEANNENAQDVKINGDNKEAVTGVDDFDKSEKIELKACCPAACLALVSYTTNTVLAVACFVISVSTHTAMRTGWVVNYMDLSPNFSGSLMACGNTLASVPVVLLPVLVSQVVTDVNDAIQWRILFFLMSGLTLVTSMVFVCFMSTDVQPWNDDAEEKGWGYRHQQCVVLFFMVMVAYSMRSCMGVTLVAMVDHTNNVTLMESNVVTRQEPEETGNSTAAALLLVPPYPQFQWDKKTQDIILSSFFWGYMLLQIPAGQLNHMFGPRFMLTMALMVNGITALLLPWAAYYGGWIAAALMRFVQGLGQSCIFPGMHCLFGKWTPLEERGRLAGCAYGGQALGLVVGLPISGYIAASPLGWPGVFRFYGILCCVAAGILWWICADSPAKHTSISELERMYIEKNLGQSRFKKVPPVPWCRILKSRGLYAIMIAHIGQNFSHVTIYSEIPSFMDKIMHVNIKANGLLTALPFLCMFFANFFFSWMTDILIVKKIMSVTNTRKLANSIGSVPVALGLVALALSPKDIYVVESLLIAICSLKVASHLGFQLNHIDMSSNYSGTLMSITNFISNLCASLAPITAGLILQDVTSEQQWCTVFYVSAAFLFFSNLGYVILGTSEKQDWDNPQEPKKEDMREMERFVVQ